MNGLAAAMRLGVEREVALQALRNLDDGTVVWLVLSGKLCSGKDTIAPLLLPALGRSGVRIGYSDPMRAELQLAIDALTGRDEPVAVLAGELEGLLGLAARHALEMAELLGPAVRDPAHAVGASVRSDLTRTLLQKLGSTWRCEDDPEYWSRRVSALCLQRLAEGHSVYLTGGRFLPDVEIPAALGAVTVRLDVSRSVQMERCAARDGLLPDEATLTHPGEVALDDWPGFDVRVSNDGALQDALAEVVAQLQRLS